MVARWVHNPKVTGSNPVPATKENNEFHKITNKSLAPFIPRGLLARHSFTSWPFCNADLVSVIFIILGPVI